MRLSIGIEHSNIVTKHARRPLLSLKPGMGPHSAHVPDAPRRTGQILLAHPSAGKSETYIAEARCALTYRSRAVRRIKSRRRCGARAPTPAERTVPLAPLAGANSSHPRRRRATTFSQSLWAPAARDSARERARLCAPRANLRRAKRSNHTVKRPGTRGWSLRSYRIAPQQHVSRKPMQGMCALSLFQQIATREHDHKGAQAVRKAGLALRPPSRQSARSRGLRHPPSKRPIAGVRAPRSDRAA